MNSFSKKKAVSKEIMSQQNHDDSDTRSGRDESNEPRHHHHHHHHHHDDDDSFGDFQANVGRVGSKASLVGAWILAVIFIIIGVVMAIFAFIPTRKDSCDTDLSDAQQSLDNCEKAVKEAPPASDTVVPRDCDDDEKNLAETNTKCKKKRNYYLLFGLLLIPLGILIVWGAKKWDQKVQTSRSAAQISGALTEAGIVSDLLSR